MTHQFLKNKYFILNKLFAKSNLINALISILFIYVS